jgi:hypothetical protein
MTCRFEAIVPLLLLLLVPVAAFAQENPSVVCKGSAIPEGFVISGETISTACRGETAWIVKQTRRQPNSLDRFASAATNMFSDAAPNEVIAAGQCNAFQKDIASTYNFNAAGLTDEQVEAQSRRLDAFWNKVRESRATLVPCLRKALTDEHSKSFFNIDGSMLLVDVDPSRASKALQVRKFIDADLNGTDLEYWVATIARRGVEGFDTSAAGAKWLAYPKAKYNLKIHGGYPIGSFLGAVFIFGSMDEDLATPVLLKIINEVDHPHRDDALAILMSQATLASMEALRQVNAAGFPKGTDQSIRDLLEHPKLLKPRANPKLTREEQLNAFQGIINGNYQPFREMVMKAPDGEVDAVATLRSEDIPLLRRARRASISRCNQHAVSDYASFTSILWALTWKAHSQPSAAGAK